MSLLLLFHPRSAATPPTVVAADLSIAAEAAFAAQGAAVAEDALQVDAVGAFDAVGATAGTVAEADLSIAAEGMFVFEGTAEEAEQRRHSTWVGRGRLDLIRRRRRAEIEADDAEVLELLKLIAERLP